MTLNSTSYSTRSLSLLLLAAFAGMGLWLFAPWGGGQGAGTAPGGGDSASAALPSSLKVDGAVQTDVSDNVVTRVVVPLILRGDQGIALDGTMRAETAMSESAAAAVPATFSVAWQDGNGDQVLDPGEHATLTADLPARSSVHPGNPLDLVIKTAGGETLRIEDILAR